MNELIAPPGTVGGYEAPFMVVTVRAGIVPVNAKTFWAIILETFSTPFGPRVIPPMDAFAAVIDVVVITAFAVSVPVILALAAVRSPLVVKEPPETAPEIAADAPEIPPMDVKAATVAVLVATRNPVFMEP